MALNIRETITPKNQPLDAENRSNTETDVPHRYENALNRVFSGDLDTIKESNEKPKIHVPEKTKDGKYRDPETGKIFDSIGAWIVHQCTIIRRFVSIANTYHKRADKEYAQYMNAEANGLTAAEKWEHYQKSQHYYQLEKDYRERIKARMEALKKVIDEEDVDVKKLSGEELAEVIINNPQAVIDAAPEENAEEVEELCEEIAAAFENEEDVVVSGGLLPQYQAMIDSGEYESVEELCNDLGLDYDDVYDTTEKPYGEEYRKGFEDAINGKAVDPDEQSDAYKDGQAAAAELMDLLED